MNHLRNLEISFKTSLEYFGLMKKRIMKLVYEIN